MRKPKMFELERALRILEQKPVNKDVLRRIAKILKMMSKVGR